MVMWMVVKWADWRVAWWGEVKAELLDEMNVL